MNATLMMPMSSRSTVDFGADAFDERGAAPDAYAALFDRFDATSLGIEATRVQTEMEADEVLFGGADPHPFDVDPVPRIITADEWGSLERGLIQRVTALNAFIADVYGERRIIDSGVVPARLVDDADWYEPAMAAAGAPRVKAHVAGPDLVRDPGGEFRVLEDNLRAPSGLAYLLAARRALMPLADACGLKPRSLQPALDALAAVIGGAAPDGREQPTVVLLNDGVQSSAFYEHRALARLVGMRVASAAELSRHGDRLLIDGSKGVEGVDVIYRRVDDERLTDADGSPTALGELLIGPLLAGTLGCVNSPGSGVADDKACHIYVERMIEFYLGEAPLLRSVPGYDLGDPEELERALPILGDLVVKPRSDFGGQGVLIGPLASPGEREQMIERVLRAPGRFIAQEPVALSVHPTVVGGRLVNRHVDLRPFVVCAGQLVTVAAGGLSRFARAEGEMVVNSGRGGGAKDTWIL